MNLNDQLYHLTENHLGFVKLIPTILRDVEPIRRAWIAHLKKFAFTPKSRKLVTGKITVWFIYDILCG